MAGALAGLYAPASARVQPAALAAGIAAAAERRGVQIYEATPVSAIDPAAGGAGARGSAVARTKFGDVRARSVLRCTEGYTAALPGLRRALLPMNSHMVVTEPLSPAAWKEIGWDGCETLADEAHAYMYAQRTADGRIALGGRGVPYRYGSAVDHLGETDPSTVAALTAVLRKMFPAAASAEIAHAWCGVLGVPRDWCATVTYNPASGLGWAGGYTGHGVAAANLAGRTLADLVLGQPSPLTALPWVGHRSRTWEPEPARWAGVHGLYSLYRLADRLESPDRLEGRASGWERRSDAWATRFPASRISVGGMSDEDLTPEVLAGIRALHERIDELHRVVAHGLEVEGVHPEGIDAERMHSAGEWMHARSLAGAALHAARAIPAWQRRTQGELRWPVTLTTAVAIALQFAVPDRLVLVHPYWVLPAVQGALLIVLVMANPHRIDRESKALRVLALIFAALLSLANGWSVARLAIGITAGHHRRHARPPADHRRHGLADQRDRVRPVVLGVRPRRPGRAGA